MARRIASALAVLAALALAACETEPASQTGYFDATVHAKVGCVDTRGNDSGYDAQWRIAYRLVGASGAWTADPWHDYTCPDEQVPHYLPGSPFAEQLTGLKQNRQYEYRLEVQHASGAPATFEWRDSAGTKNGTAYDTFTTDAFPTVTPKSAASFRDSQGINTRTAFSRTNWTNFPKNREAIEFMGIRHLRDGLHPPTTAAGAAQYAFLKSLYQDLGVRTRTGLGAMDTDKNGTCGPFKSAEALAEIRADGVMAQAVDSIEGQNEVDGIHGEPIPGWQSCVRQKTEHDYGLIAGEWPFTGPSFVAASAFDQVGDLSQWLDFGNIHPYPGGQPPEFEALDFHIPRAQKISGTKSIEATETGYYDNPLVPFSVSRPVMATYTLRLLFENYRRNIPRTYLYAIVDPRCPGTEDTSTTMKWTYGLYDCNWQSKGVAEVIHNMNVTVGDGAPTPTPLPWRVDTAPSDYRQVVLRRSDGAYVVAAWRTASVWDRDTKTPITPQPQAFIAMAPDAQSIHYVKPTDSAIEHPTSFEDGKLTFILGGEPILFVIR